MRRADLALELALFGLALAFAVAGGARLPDLGAYEPPPRSLSDFRVVTWNVGEPGSRLRDESVPHVAGVLRELDPDLILLQEVGGTGQLRALARAIGGEWERLDSNGVAVLARGHLEELDSGMPVGRNQAFRQLRGPRDGPAVVGVAVHADAWAAEARNVELGMLSDWLRGQDAALRLLAGDFNLDLDLDKRRDLFTNDEHLDVETYNYAARGFHDAGVESGPTAEPDRRLDYVFWASDALELFAAGPWKRKRFAAMDHDPLVADFTERRGR